MIFDDWFPVTYDMKTVGNFPDLASARLAQAMLEGEGIPSTIPDEHLAGLDWRMSGALGGVRLQVSPEHAEAAVALLEQGTAVDPEELDRLAVGNDQASDIETCPSCGSSSIGPARPRSRAKALTMLFFPFLLLAWPFLAASRRKRICSACSHTWRPTA